MEWSFCFTALFTLITGVCTVWNVYDRLVEKQPFAAYFKGDIYVSNPRRKAVVIRSMSFTGDPVTIENGKLPQNNARRQIDLIVLVGETVRAPWWVHLGDHLLYEAKLKKITWCNWDEFHLIVRTIKRPETSPPVNENSQEPVQKDYNMLLMTILLKNKNSLSWGT